MWRRAVLFVGLFALAAAAVGAALTVGVLRHLDSVVVEKFSGRRWNFPSRIYSDSFLIYPGLNVEAAGLPDRLRRLNYRASDTGALRKGDFRRTKDSLDLFLRDFTY